MNAPDDRLQTALSMADLDNLHRRLAAEAPILERYWPTIRLQDADGGPNPGAVGTLRTQSDTVYTVFLDLRRYPNSPPPAWVVRPALKDKNGRLLSDYGTNAAMHVLEGTWDHRVQVCHHGGHCWTPRLTMHHVLFKVRVWLEAYEGHLRTGQPIDHWLKHQ